MPKVAKRRGTHQLFQKMRLFTILPLSLLLITTPTSNSAPSALDQIVQDLSILTRITNAIALQNAAIQKTLKVRDVVAEILRVNRVAFSQVLSLNTSFLGGKFQKFHEKAIKRPYSDLERFRKKNSYLQSIIERAGGNKTGIDNFSAANLIKLIDTNQGIDLPCDQRLLKTVALFTDTINKERPGPRVLEHKYLMEFRNSTDEVLECFRRCENYSSRGDEIQKELKALQETFRLHDRLVHFNEYFSFFELEFPQILTSLNTDIQNTGFLTGDVYGTVIHNITSAILGILVSKPAPLSLAPAFSHGTSLKASDLKKVSEDVKSRWFQEKISRGKSTWQFEKSLVPFHHFAEEVAKLQLPWGYFHNPNTSSTMFGRLNTLAKEFRESEEALGGFKRPLDKLQAAQRNYKVCWQSSAVARIDEVAISRFSESLEQPSILLQDISLINKAISNIRKTMTSEMLEGILIDFKALIPADSSQSEVRNHRRDMKRIPDYEKFEGLLYSMKDLYMVQSAYLETFEDVRNNRTFSDDSFNMVQPLAASNFFRWVRCLKTNKLNPKLIKESAVFMEKMVHLASPESVGLINGSLERVARIQKVLEDVEKAARGMESSESSTNMILNLKESQGIALHLASGLHVLLEMVRVQNSREHLQTLFQFPPRILDVIRGEVRDSPAEKRFWDFPERDIGRILQAIDTLSRTSSSKKLLDLQTIGEVFKEAEAVPGIDGHHEIFSRVPGHLEGFQRRPEAVQTVLKSQELMTWDLDFAAKKKTLDAAYLTFTPLSTFFDEVFGFTTDRTVILRPVVFYLEVVALCFGFFALLLLLAFILYGFTKNGRRKYRNTYLYYFPNRVEFEKRWRYSLFMDRENGQNALIDASREINHINVQNILARGALVNVYSQFGNTPLHMATQRGFPKVVEVLIKNGADRNSKNARNQTPEQLIPTKCEDGEDAVRYAGIRRMYNKYRRKTFRIRVPQEFPTHLFHIFIEKRTDDDLTSAFMNRFQGITSDEALPTTTHCICKSTDNGTLETDDVDLLAWIFTGVIMVRESWMTDCMADERLIANDSRYLVEHVKYHGRVYENCVVPWTTALAKGEMPFLYGAFVVFVMKECPKLANLTLIITTLGGVFLEEFPTKETFNKGSHPYLHVNMGPAFLIHDGQTDLSPYQNDPDKLYTLFTEQEFISFLLRREVNQDTSEHVIPQLFGTE